VFVVIFDPGNAVDPYLVGPFPTKVHAQAYAATDPDIGNHSVHGQRSIVVELSAPATFTTKPPCLTEAQHRRAEMEGWSIFVHEDGNQYVAAIDELNILPSDVPANRLARRMGLRVSINGKVLGKARRQTNQRSKPIGKPQVNLNTLVKALGKVKESVRRV
jgi:hypothetical protein